MPTAEQFARLLEQDDRGVHALLWDDQQDLVHALLIIRAVYGAERIFTHVVSAGSAGIEALRVLADSRCTPDDYDDQVCGRPPLAGHLWMLFLPQAGSVALGPCLNGWRRPLSEPPGTVLVVRAADFDAFQRHAPDLTSFIGPRVHDTSTMLSVFSPQTAERLERTVPPVLEAVLKRLPGVPPTGDELTEWLTAHDPRPGAPPG